MRLSVIAVFFTIFQGQIDGLGRFSWMGYDHFDELDDHMRTIDGSNCRAKTKSELVLRPDTVSQLPVYNELLDRVWYKNRSALIHMHNMALNRAMFYSYILQKMNDSTSFHVQPNWLYMYMSVSADVNANPDMINGSAIYFDMDSHYPNWYTTIHFNKTLPLFGPKAWRWDDYNEQGNLLREPTRRVVVVSDLGTGQGMNYTHPLFRMNPWYTKWLPDSSGSMDSLTKFTYHVGVKYSNETGRFSTDDFETSTFFGPSLPSAQEKDERNLPVVFTQPYFDCGHSNQWIVSTVSPVVDYMPRYSNWTHLRRPRFVAVVVLDTYFKKVDFNPCGISPGNPGPSYLAGIHRCRKTTSCFHKSGYGFRRGSYVCNCNGGYRFQWSIQGPFQGETIEQAVDDEYNNGFQCSVIDFKQVLPTVEHEEVVNIEGGYNTLTSGGKSDMQSRILRSVNVSRKTDDDAISGVVYGSTLLDNRLNNVMQSNKNNESFRPDRPIVMIPRGMHSDIQAAHDRKPIKRAQIELAKERRLQEAVAAAQKANQRKQKVIQNDLRPTNRHKRAAEFDEQAFQRMMRIFRQKASVTKDNCHTLAPHNLLLPGDVSYGATTQFEPEARTALRLSHFLSNFLQNTNPEENFGNLRGGGRLHIEHVFGEVLSNVMGNFKIYSSGVFFDRFKFENQDGKAREYFGPWAYKKDGRFFVLDMAGITSLYTDQEWFQTVKNRWNTNVVGLETYKMRSYIRSDPKGTSSMKHEHFPLKYKAPAYSAGFWTRPYFRCDGKVDAWVITYVTPFFGLKSFKKTIDFKGVVTVDVPLDHLELNQCSHGFGVANAFKNTARCDYFSTKCQPLAGFAFMRGSYRCDCRIGFEYPHLDGKSWIEGSLLEIEYEKKIRGMFSRFDHLKCRVAAATELSSTPVLLLVSSVLSWLASRITL